MKDSRSDEQLNDHLKAGLAEARAAKEAGRTQDAKEVESFQQTGAEIYDRYFGLLRAHFINKVADPAAWDELTQLTLEVMLTKPETFKGDSPYRSWVYGIARNMLRTHYRNTRKRVARQDDSIEFIDELPVSHIGVAQSSLLARYADVQRLIDSLRKIPIKNQRAFELYYFEGMSAREIAKLEDPECSLNTIRGRLRLAKQQLEKLGVAQEMIDALARRVRQELLGDDASEAPTDGEADEDSVA